MEREGVWTLLTAAVPRGERTTQEASKMSQKKTPAGLLFDAATTNEPLFSFSEENQRNRIYGWWRPVFTGRVQEDCLYSSVLSLFHFSSHIILRRRARLRESSFTAENLAKINFLLLFLALAGQSKHDRFHSFCPRGSHFPPEACSACFFLLLSVWDGLDVYRRLLIACARIDCAWCLWRLLSTHWVIWRRRRMFMHMHASQLHKSEPDLRVCLHLSTCVHRVTNGWQAACPAAGGGRGGGQWAHIVLDSLITSILLHLI